MSWNSKIDNGLMMKPGYSQLAERRNWIFNAFYFCLFIQERNFIVYKEIKMHLMRN
jgi:hypothetical protein